MPRNLWISFKVHKIIHLIITIGSRWYNIYNIIVCIFEAFLLLLGPPTTNNKAPFVFILNYFFNEYSNLLISHTTFLENRNEIHHVPYGIIKYYEYSGWIQINVLLPLHYLLYQIFSSSLWKCMYLIPTFVQLWIFLDLNQGDGMGAAY